MREKFVDILECPQDDCRGEIQLGEVTKRDGDNILGGELQCVACGRNYTIHRGIPRFVDRTGYDDSWAWQWERFHHVRGRSQDGTNWIEEAVMGRPRWTPEHLHGKTILEFGCGSGNDTEVLADHAGTLISLELSGAVDVVSEDILTKDHVLVMQADLLHVPVKRAAVDIGFCHRVIMHTPDPKTSFKSMAQHIKPGGEFFLHSYDRHIKSMLQAKYLYRPITKRLSPKTVCRILCIIGPVLYPLVGILRRVGIFRKPVKLLIPFSNHSRGLVRDGTTLNVRERYDFNMLMTFDALAPKFDNPSSPEMMSQWFEEAGYECVELLGRNPVCMKAWRCKESI